MPRMPTVTLLAALLLAPPGFLKTTLENGLEVLVEERRGAPTVAVRVYVKTGSIGEAERLGSGISHLYEHILHGGTTTTRTEKECATLLQAIGGSSNAYTRYDVTAYHVTTTPEHAGTAIDLLADWMRNNVMDPAEVAREREVVQRELEKGEDEPATVLRHLYQATAFRTHPVRVPVIGYRENIARLTRDDLVAFYRERYVPNNAVVAVVGDLAKEEALALVKAAFGPWERGPLPAFALPAEPAQIAPRRAEREMGVATPKVRFGWPTVPLHDPDLYALDVLAFVLGEGESSRLARRVVDEKRLARRASATSWTPAFGAGQLHVDLDVDDAGRIDAALEAALEECEAAARHQHAGDVERAIRLKRAERAAQVQSNEGRAEDLALSLIATGDPHFGDRYLERIERVKPEDVRAAARRYLVPERLTVAVLRPPARPGEAGIGGREAAAPAATATKTILPNGLVLIVKPMPGTRTVAISAYFQGGGRAETPETAGLFHLLSRLMVRAGEGRIVREAEALGGRIDPDSGFAAFGVNASFLAPDLDLGLMIVEEALRRPRFTPADVERERGNALFALRSIADDWQAEATYLFREALFGAHPYGRKPAGAEASLRALDRATLEAAWEHHVVPGNCTLAVSGDIDPEAVRRAVESSFGAWRGAPPRLPPLPAPPALDAPVEVEKRTAKGQTTICLGWPGLSVESGDRFALDLIDAATSGIGLPGGRLHQGLRGGERSLVYFVHAIAWYGVDAGAYYVLTRCNPEDEAEVLEVIGDVHARVQKPGGLTDAELERARTIAIAARRIALETPAQQARQAALDETFGLGHDFTERYVARIRATTSDDVHRVAARVFGAPGVLAVVRPAPAPAPPPPPPTKER